MSSFNTLGALPENHLVVGISNTEARYESYDAARDFFKRPRHIHLVLPLIQKTDTRFSAKLESELYPYGTKRNDLLHSRTLLWQDIAWGIMSIPRQEEKLVQSFCNLEQRYFDRGVYTVTTSKGSSETFPFSSDSFRSIRFTQGRYLLAMSM